MLTSRFRSAALTVAIVALAATAAIALSPSGGRDIALAQTETLGAGGEYHELAPARIYDSRSGGAHGMGSGGAFDVPLRGRGGVPESADDVLAVVANVTVVAPSQRGHLQIVPKGASAGTSSVLNFEAGQTVANSTIMRPGDGGQVSLNLVSQNPGTAHVVIDVSGFISKSNYSDRGARAITIDPTRLYDSKSNRLGHDWVNLQVTGKAGVPDDAVGVIVNLTGANRFSGSLNTHLSLVPTRPTNDPTTSNLNLRSGQTRANLAIVPLGPNGNIHLFNLRGDVRAVVDVVGYLQPRPDDTATGRVIPLVSSFRAFDTRLEEFANQPLGPGRAEDFSFDAFVADVKIGEQVVGPQSGLFGNLTAVGLERNFDWAPVQSHMSAYPTPADGESHDPPTISNLNFGEGEVVPNMALLRYDDNHRIRFFNYDGHIDYVLDVYAVVLE